MQKTRSQIIKGGCPHQQLTFQLLSKVEKQLLQGPFSSLVSVSLGFYKHSFCIFLIFLPDYRPTHSHTHTQKQNKGKHKSERLALSFRPIPVPVQQVMKTLHRCLRISNAAVLQLELAWARLGTTRCSQLPLLLLSLANT